MAEWLRLWSGPPWVGYRLHEPSGALLPDTSDLHPFVRTAFFRFPPMQQEISRQQILKLAAESMLDPRTIKRAVDFGIGSMKSEFDKQRLREAAEKVGLKLEESKPMPRKR